MANRKKILGGMFGWKEYEKKSSQNYSFLSDKNIFLFNGRSAIFSIINTLKPEKVWLPDYLCETILDAVNKTKTKINFYNINYNLKIDNLDWIKKLNNNDLVILIEYFGFPVEPDIIKKIKTKKAGILLDAAQSLLSKNTRAASDFIVYSPRKLVGVPAGAVIQTNNKKFISNIYLQYVCEENLFFIYKAYQKRTAFDNDFRTEWYNDYKLSVQNQIIGNYRIDDFSLSVLKFGINYKNIAEKRRENYKFLLSELSDIAIYKTLPDNVVPLGFPILSDKRGEIIEMLYKNSIFAPVHWPVTDNNRPYNKMLKKNEITLICDQRYNSEDLMQMVKLIKSKL